MLSKLKAADFQQFVGQEFELSRDENVFPLQLAEVTVLGKSLRKGGSFSVVFESTKELGLEQGIYSLAHERMETLELFLVPIGPFGNGEGYESVFN